MTRYVIDPPTLLHLITADARLDPEHQLVAPHQLQWLTTSTLCPSGSRTNAP